MPEQYYPVLLAMGIAITMGIVILSLSWILGKIAGHQHGPGMAVVSDTTPIGARGANLFNVVDGSLAERALLTRLDAWVAEGIEPPASTFPRLADRTAVDREWLLAQFRGLPGVSARADFEMILRLRNAEIAEELA